MVIIASKDRSSRVQGSPPGDLRLQVVGSARDGQIVELAAAKCAIGSAAGCTLRLRARGVRPVHCLILRGANGTVARSWAPNTRINGQPFRDALLEAGDRLSIGPVEFEVLPAKEGPLSDPTDAGRTVVLDRRPAAKGLRRELSSQVTIRRARRRTQVHSLVSEVRRLRSQIERAASLPQAAEPQQDADASQELHARLEAYKLQNDHWEATLQDLQGELDSRERQLAEHLAELDSARSAFEDERKEWQSDLDTTRVQLASYRDAARLAEETLVLVRAELEQAERNSATELNALRQRLADREAELAAALDRHAATTDRLRLLEQTATEFDELTRQFADERAAWQQSNTEDNRAAEELKLAREEFDARQAEAWCELEEQRSSAAALESTNREALIENERRAASLTDAEVELGERQAALSEDEAKLQADRQRFAEEHAAQDAELRERADALQLQAVELASKGHDLATRVADQSAASSAPEMEIDLSAAQDLATRQAELEQRLAEFARERQEWETSLTARAEQFERAQEELQTERRQLAVDRESHEQQLRERTRDLDDRLAQLAELSSQPITADAGAGERENLDDQRAELEHARAELSEEREAVEKLRQKTSDRLDADARELERERQELAAERAAFEAERKASQEREVPIARSWQAAPQEEDVEESESPAPTRYFTPPASEVETVRGEAGMADTARSLSAGDKEESIEEYMAALLTRMRGGAELQTNIPAPGAPRRDKRKSDVSRPAPQITSAGTTEEAEQADPEEPTPVLDMPAVLKELERRKSTELPRNLNVLREIGITHARSAIESHGQRRSLRQAYGTLATSIFCFVAAFAVFYFSKSAATHLTGTTILVVGIFWMGTSMWAVKKVVSSMRKKRSGLRSMMEEIEAEIALLEKERAEAAAEQE
jgi:hypothetical protein